MREVRESKRTHRFSVTLFFHLYILSSATIDCIEHFMPRKTLPPYLYIYIS